MGNRLTRMVSKATIRRTVNHLRTERVKLEEGIATFNLSCYFFKQEIQCFTRPFFLHSTKVKCWPSPWSNGHSQNALNWKTICTSDLTAQKKVHLIISTLVTSEKLPEKSLFSVSLPLFLYPSFSFLPDTHNAKANTNFLRFGHTHREVLSLSRSY